MASLAALHDDGMTVQMVAPAISLPEETERLWPLWLQVELTLRRAIRAGALKAGEQLPGEHQLAETLGIHRHTVRRAIESLAGQGLLEIRRGRGTFVAAGPISFRLGGRSRFTDNMEAAGKIPSARVLRSQTLTATEDVAANLALRSGDKVVMLEILRLGDAIPILIARHFVPEDLFPDYAERFASIDSITKTFASYGIVGYRRTITRLAARRPTAQEAADLGQPRTAPVLVWASVNAVPGGRRVNYDLSVFAAARVSIVIDDDG
jgi:GntR family transcriptional regulator, phosphonate transport system regulatory protein